MRLIPKKYIGFTLVEVLIATAILSIFLTSVFKMYSMGGKMFTSGTWHQNTQKQAERFFAKIRNRAARTSAPIQINKDGTFSNILPFFGVATSTITATTAKPRRIICFPVCAASRKGSQGIVMYHILRAVKSKYSNKVFNLEFLSTKNLNYGKGLEFATGLKYLWFNGTFDAKLFKGNANDFELGPDHEEVTVLQDVSEVTFTNIGRIINLHLTFKNPKDLKTSLKLEVSISCDEYALFDSRSEL